MKHLFITFFGLLITLNLSSQSLNDLYKKSMESYKNNEFEAFRDYSLEALNIHPSQPTLLYNLGLSYALLKNYNASFEQFSYLLSWNANLKLNENEELSDFLDSSDYREDFKSKRELFLKQSIKSELFLSLSKKSHIEDFVINGDYFYYTDLHNGMVVKYNQKLGFLDSKAYFMSSPMAIAQDSNLQFLWVSTSMIQNYREFKEHEKNNATLFKLRKKDMHVVNEIEIPNKSIIGSMVTYKSKLYATSSLNPELLIINTDNNTVQDIIKIDEAFNLQGIAIDQEKEFLYVADYIKGIVKINLNDYTDRVWLKTSKDYLLKGIDGLTFLNSNTLFAVQNSSTPKRVIKIIHNSNMISKIEIIDNALETKGEPTNIKLTSHGLLYLSNSQWPLYDNTGKADYPLWENQDIRLISQPKL
nr:hypothetical protein [uncultured Psychroserpens sp.]